MKKIITITLLSLSFLVFSACSSNNQSKKEALASQSSAKKEAEKVYKDFMTEADQVIPKMNDAVKNFDKLNIEDWQRKTWELNRLEDNTKVKMYAVERLVDEKQLSKDQLEKFKKKVQVLKTASAEVAKKKQAFKEKVHQKYLVYIDTISRMTSEMKEWTKNYASYTIQDKRQILQELDTLGAELDRQTEEIYDLYGNDQFSVEERAKLNEKAEEYRIASEDFNNKVQAVEDANEQGQGV